MSYPTDSTKIKISSIGVILATKTFSNIALCNHNSAKMSHVGVSALARNVFFYDLRDPSTLLGGLVLNHGVTNANLYSMIGVVLIISDSYSLQNDSSETLPQDSQPLLPGNYFVVTNGKSLIYYLN